MRVRSFDALRGISIVAVVILHGTYLPASDAISLNNMIYLFCHELLLFCVPAFLFVSGYWMAKKNEFAKDHYWRSLIKRLRRILIPYLFWSLVTFLLLLLHGGASVTMKEIVFKLLTGSALFPYYFIILLAQLYILTPVIIYLNRSTVGTSAIVIMNIISLLLIYVSRLGFGLSMSVYDGFFYFWIIFYQLGLNIGMNSEFLNSVNIRLLHIATSCAVVLCFLEGFILATTFHQWIFAASVFKLSSFMFSICMILILYHYKDNFGRIGVLVELGQCSFGIYLIHMLVMPRLDRIVEKMSLFYPSNPAYPIFVSLLTTLFCVIIIKMTKKIIPNVIYSPILGF